MINSREVFEIARNKGLEVAEGLLVSVTSSEEGVKQ